MSFELSHAISIGGYLITYCFGGPPDRSPLFLAGMGGGPIAEVLTAVLGLTIVIILLASVHKPFKWTGSLGPKP